MTCNTRKDSCGSGGTLQHDLFDLSIQNYKDDFDFITPDILEKETEVICNSDNIKFSEFLLTLES